MKTIAKKGRRTLLLMFAISFMLIMLSSVRLNSNTHAQTSPVTLTTLCHYGVTIKVSPKAVSYHLKHGDYMGACANPKPANIPIAN